MSISYSLLDLMIFWSIVKEIGFFFLIKCNSWGGREEVVERVVGGGEGGGGDGWRVIHVEHLFCSCKSCLTAIWLEPQLLDLRMFIICSRYQEMILSWYTRFPQCLVSQSLKIVDVSVLGHKSFRKKRPLQVQKTKYWYNYQTSFTSFELFAQDKRWYNFSCQKCWTLCITDHTRSQDSKKMLGNYAATRWRKFSRFLVQLLWNIWKLRSNCQKLITNSDVC